MSPSDLKPTDLIDIDHLLSDEEKQIREVAREWVQRRILPEVEDWYEKGEFPARELAKEVGDLGFFLMQLDTEWTLGLNSVAYGLVELEIEAGDSGLRSFVSVQSSLCGHAIHAFGSEEQKNEWLPKMASGEAIACFGLSEPDSGSDPGSMRTTAKKDGDDWILNGTKMWITNGSCSDIAIVWAQTDDGVRGFIVPTDSPGFTANDIHKKMSLRASVTSELVMDGVRLPADAMLPGGEGTPRAAVLLERGPLRDRVGRDGRGAHVLRDGARVLEDARAVRQADRLVPAHAEEAHRHGARAVQGDAARLPPRPAEGREGPRSRSR